MKPHNGLLSLRSTALHLIQITFPFPRKRNTTRIGWLVEIIDVYNDNHTKPLQTLCGQNPVTESGKHSVKGVHTSGLPATCSFDELHLRNIPQTAE